MIRANVLYLFVIVIETQALILSRRLGREGEPEWPHPESCAELAQEGGPRARTPPAAVLPLLPPVRGARSPRGEAPHPICSAHQGWSSTINVFLLCNNTGLRVALMYVVRMYSIFKLQQHVARSRRGIDFVQHCFCCSLPNSNTRNMVCASCNVTLLRYKKVLLVLLDLQRNARHSAFVRGVNSQGPAPWLIETCVLVLRVGQICHTCSHMVVLRAARIFPIQDPCAGFSPWPSVPANFKYSIEGKETRNTRPAVSNVVVLEGTLSCPDYITNMAG